MREWRPRRRVCQGQPEQADIALKLRSHQPCCTSDAACNPLLHYFTTGTGDRHDHSVCPQAFRSPKSSASLSPDRRIGHFDRSKGQAVYVPHGQG